MGIEKIFNFAVSSAEFIEQSNNNLFRKMKIRAFASGENAHTLPVDQDVIKRCAHSVYDKPIVWKYNRWTDDAMGHEEDEVPVGFVKESDENPVIFEQDGDRIFMTVEALIWTKYCGRLIDIFQRDGGVKDVSIEINTCVEEVELCDKPIIKDFCVAGITILGEMINPAVKGCCATLLEFSEAKKEYLNNIEFSGDIKIDNSKEASVSGKWSNPRRKLFVPISKASNKVVLLKEAYLLGDFDSKEPEITKFKYPHHVIRNGVLVVHKDGLQAAFQRAPQQGIVNGNVKSHLMKHYKELGLTTENFSEFGISENDFSLYFSDYINQSESGCNTEMEQEIKNSELEVDNSAETNVSDVEIENSTEQTIENSEPTMEEVDNCDISPVAVEMEDGDEKEDKEPENAEDDKKEEEMACEPASEEMSDATDDECSEEMSTAEEEMSIDDAKAKIAEMSETIARLEADKNAYMSKIESMSDYEDLKKFKMETEEKMAREAEMSEMEQVMSEICEKGFSFSDEDKQKLMSEFKNFSSVDAWKNYVKAQAFDKTDSNGFAKMGLPEINIQPSTGSIWDKF